MPCISMPLREQEGLRSDVNLSSEGRHSAVPRGSSTCEEDRFVSHQVIRLDLLGKLPHCSLDAIFDESPCKHQD